MGRWAKRIALGLFILVGVLAAPILWIEGACTEPRITRELSARVVDDSGYVRRESDSYLSFPKWHTVYAYEDLAGVLRDSDESRFAYGRQIAGFWGTLCGLHRVVTSRSRAAMDTKVMLYMIGWSFTAEMAIKGAYEKSVGRLFEWARGPRKTAEDEFAARDMQAYAAFLRRTPWYEYPFAARLSAFWRETPRRGPHVARKLERRLVVSTEYGVKAIYGTLIGFGADATLGPADPHIYTVVVGPGRRDLARDPRITIVRDLGAGRTLIRTPRHQAYTDFVVDLARRGWDVVEIAGNRRILITVLAPKAALPALSGTTELFELAIQSQPDRRRVALDVSVALLAATIRALERAGTVIEHVYDY
jgi:hypothetical protein